MAGNWFYTHAGQTHGPFSTAELRRRAAAGLLEPDDLLWPDSADPQRAVVAGAALDFPGLVGKAIAPSDWLPDVQRVEQAASRIETANPDWLEDVRRSLSRDGSQGPPMARKPGKTRRVVAFVIRQVRRWFGAPSPEGAARPKQNP